MTVVEVSTSVGNKTLVARCEREHETRAQSMLRSFEQFAHSAQGLQDGTTIRFGWSVLTLKREANAKFRIFEPDFRSDPFSRLNDDVSLTLSVTADQVRVLGLAGAEGDPPLFSERLVAHKGVFKRKLVYLERRATKVDNDCGWYIGPVKKSKQEEYEGLWVYELLQKRRELMQVLALPVGYLVVFDGLKIQSIDDPQHEEVWRVS